MTLMVSFYNPGFMVLNHLVKSHQASPSIRRRGNSECHSNLFGFGHALDKQNLAASSLAILRLVPGTARPFDE